MSRSLSLVLWSSSSPAHGGTGEFLAGVLLGSCSLCIQGAAFSWKAAVSGGREVLQCGGLWPKNLTLF